MRLLQTTGWWNSKKLQHLIQHRIHKETRDAMTHPRTAHFSQSQVHWILNFPLDHEAHHKLSNRTLAIEERLGGLSRVRVWCCICYSQIQGGLSYWRWFWLQVTETQLRKCKTNLKIYCKTSIASLGTLVPGYIQTTRIVDRSAAGNYIS